MLLSSFYAQHCDSGGSDKTDIQTALSVQFGPFRKPSYHGVRELPEMGHHLEYNPAVMKNKSAVCSTERRLPLC